MVNQAGGLLSLVDAASKRLSPLNTAIDLISAKIIPRVAAQACGDAVYCGISYCTDSACCGSTRKRVKTYAATKELCQSTGGTAYCYSCDSSCGPCPT